MEKTCTFCGEPATNGSWCMDCRDIREAWLRTLIENMLAGPLR